MKFVKSVLKGAAILALMVLYLPVALPAVLASMGGDQRLLRWLEGRVPSPSGPGYIEPVDAWPQPQARRPNSKVDEPAALN